MAASRTLSQTSLNVEHPDPAVGEDLWKQPSRMLDSRILFLKSSNAEHLRLVLYVLHIITDLDPAK
jgi:hypothetical protein